MTNRDFYDPQTRRFISDSLPTVTKKFSHPQRRGPRIRATQGTISATGGMLIGSYRITGSYQGIAPGTYSMRIKRLNVGVTGGGHPVNAGSDGRFRGTGFRWALWHSREGTIDVKVFDAPGQVNQVVDHNDAIYSMGPGTMYFGFLGDQHGNSGTRLDFLQSMEGLTG
jgi:hypothetical protein